MWTYEQWAEKYGNLQHTNKPGNGVEAGTEYFEQGMQLADTGLTLDELEAYIRWWRGVEANKQARQEPERSLTPDLYFDNEENKPSFIVKPAAHALSDQERLAEIKKEYPDAKLIFGGIILKGAKGGVSVEDKIAALDRRITQLEQIIDAIKETL
jgi:hypothetical protein